MAPPPPILLLTRPEPASRRFLAEIEAEGLQGFTPVISPLIGIETAGPLPEMADVRGAIFTSANGVRTYQTLGGPVLPLCYTVGEATARAAAEAGFAPQSAGGNADDLVAMIAAEAPAGPLLHLRGTHTRGQVAERLGRAGIPTREAVIYDQPAQELSAEARAALDGESAVILPLFSVRSAAQFAKAPPGRAPLIVAAMSEDVSAALEALYVTRLEIPARPDAAHMRAVVIGLLRDSGALVQPHGSVKGWAGTATCQGKNLKGWSVADEKKPVDGTEDNAGTDAAKTPETGLTPDTVPDAVVTEEGETDAQDTSEEPGDDTAADAQPDETTGDDTAEAPDEETSEAPDAENDGIPDEAEEIPGTADAEEDDQIHSAGEAAVLDDDETEGAQADEKPQPDPEPEPAAAEPAPAPAPVVQEKVIERKGGFFPMLLGGVVAAALGYGVSAYQSGTLPFLGAAEEDTFEADTRAALDSQAGEIEALKGSVQAANDAVSGIDLSALESSVSDLGARFDSVSGEIEGLSDRIGTLDARLEEMEKRPVAETVPPEAIAAYERELDSVREAIATQRQEVEEMTRQALAAEANAEDQAALSQARAALSTIMSALTDGAPYADALAEIEANGTTVPAALSAPAADGVPTLAALTEAFPPAARAALSAARRSEAQAESGTGRFTTFLADQLGARSVTAREGDGPDAVLSRAEAALRGGDLGQTLTELEALPDQATAPLSDWIAAATARRDAVAAAEAVAQDLNKE